MPLPPDTRREAEALVIAALEAGDLKSCRIAAEAQLNYRLRESFQRIDEAREIDLNYLTCAEYQLFLDDMRVRGNCLQPDHWVDYHFPEGMALKPVLGVRPEDAEAFCKWLTQRRYDSNERYRLPTTEEAQQYLSPSEMTATWCRDVGEFKIFGLTSGEEEILKQKLRQLLNLKNPSLTPLDLESGSAEHPQSLINASGAIRGVIFLAILLFIGIQLYISHLLFLLMSLFSLAIGARPFRDDSTLSRKFAESVIILLLSLLAIFFVVPNNKEGDTYKGIAIGSIIFGWMYFWLVVKMIDAMSNYSAAPHIAEHGFEYIFSKLQLREQGVLIMENDYKRVKNISSSDYDALHSHKRKEYEYLRVVISRKESNLIAWEGIRLVRERI